MFYIFICGTRAECESDCAILKLHLFTKMGLLGGAD